MGRWKMDVSHWKVPFGSGLGVGWGKVEGFGGCLGAIEGGRGGSSGGCILGDIWGGLVELAGEVDGNGG